MVFRAHDNQYGYIYLADFHFSQSLPGAPNAGSKRHNVAFGRFRARNSEQMIVARDRDAVFLPSRADLSRD